MVKPVTPNTKGAENRARPSSEDNRFTEEVASRIEDGQYKEGAIEELAAQIGQVDSPRERAHQAKALREAIRASDLEPRDRRQAIVDLNKALAHTSRPWAQNVSATDEVETEPAPETIEEAAAPESIEAPAPMAISATTNRSDPTGLLNVGVIDLNGAPLRRA